MTTTVVARRFSKYIIHKVDDSSVLYNNGAHPVICMDCHLITC
jgi:hypothetical protein